jgi:peptide deformylase
MTIHTILKMGDPRLLEVSQVVTDFDTPELHQLIEDMRETMYANDGAGLAAPQIGVLQRVVIFENQANPRYPNVEQVPFTVLINPQLEVLSDELLGFWEGCLSLPGMRGWVERPANLRYSGYNQYGTFFERTVSGFHATVVQHECDHLDGLLYPMRMSDMSKFGFADQLLSN